MILEELFVSLRLIYGRAGSGKSHYCLDEIKKSLKSGKPGPFILIVPEQFSLQAEKTLIKAIGAGGIINVEVLTFKRMAYRVFNSVGGITRSHINSAGKCMIIQRILEDKRYEDKTNIFFGISEQQGFIKALSDMITELKKCNIKPQDLKELIVNYENYENYENITRLIYFKEKLEELEFIYENYESIVYEKYKDADDDLRILYEKLDETSMFDGATIWIDEFSGFTVQEYNIIAKLLKKADRINISLCTDCLIDETNQPAGNIDNGYINFRNSANVSIDYTDIFSPAKVTAKKLLRIAKEAGIRIELPCAVERQSGVSYRFNQSPEMDHLEKYLFSFPYKKYGTDKKAEGKTKDISIYTAANIYTEIEETARDIIRLCRDEGMRYKDIAVVCGNLDLYEKFIKAIFTQYEIPYFIDKKKEIAGHPLVKLITSVFEIFVYNFSYESVFRYLKTGLTGIPAEDIDFIENYVLACGISGNKWTKNEQWNYIPEMVWEFDNEEEYNNLLLKVNNIRECIIIPLLEFQEKLTGRRTAKEICEGLFELLCNLNVPQRIDIFVNKFKEVGELMLASEYSQIWNIAMEILDQIVELIGDERISKDRFLNILKTGFDEHKIAIIPPSLDQVMVLNIERSKMSEVEALYVLGVNDGVFPMLKTNENVLSDSERDTLASLGLELIENTKIKAFESQYMVYSVLTCARKYLRLSAPIADQEGGTLRPSIIISRIKKIFPDILEKSDIGSNVFEGDISFELELISNKKQAYNELIKTMRKFKEGKLINPIIKDIYLWFANNEKWHDKFMMAQAALNYTNLVDNIKKENAKRLYGLPMHSSISRFEQYASCPFSYYVQYGLKAKERKIFDLTQPDIGTFLHRAIEVFSNNMIKNGISWKSIDKDLCAEMVSEVSDELLQNVKGGPVKNGPKRYKAIMKRLDKVILRAIWLIAEHLKTSGFEPLGYELKFGGLDELSPIIINLPTGEIIKLSGRIDRVDALQTEDKTFIRVVDYKSGKKEFSLSDVFYGVEIQLITYLTAIWREEETARKALGKKLKLPVMPGGILYFKIDDPIIRGSKMVKDEDIEKAIMKKLRMNGLVLADLNVVKEMDKTISGDSLFIPVRINKDESISKMSSVATLEQFNLLSKYVEILLKKEGKQMQEGDISIKPYKNKQTTSCEYCEFASICQFDTTLKDNKYRIMKEYGSEEIWHLMELACEIKGEEINDGQRYKVDKRTN